MSDTPDVEYTIDVTEHAAAIYEMLHDGGSPKRAMAILMMATSMTVYNTLDEDGNQIDADKEINKFARKIKAFVKSSIENDTNPAELAFNTECIRGEIEKKSAEERAPMVGLDIVTKLAEFKDPDLALRILAAACANILTMRFTREDESVKAYNQFNHMVGQTIAAADKMGFASWVKGTAH